MAEAVPKTDTTVENLSSPATKAAPATEAVKATVAAPETNTTA